jgi:hypothetical protein
VRLPVVAFIDEIAATGMLHSEYRDIGSLSTPSTQRCRSMQTRRSSRRP